MQYLLDTNILIDLLRKRIEINESFFKEATISIITEAELYYGAYKSSNPQENPDVIEKMISDFGFKIIDLDSKTVMDFAQIKASLEKGGIRLEDFDLLIAATALSQKLTLVTRNIRHFKRIKGLKLRVI